MTYVALGRNRGKFLHVGADGAATVVEVPNAYADLSLERRTVILKIHGGIDMRPGRERESFVVSEDDHIDHLAQAEISVVVPVAVAARLRRSHFLFLGYQLQRVEPPGFLHRVWGRERVGYRSWAIGARADRARARLWRAARDRAASILPLDDYLEALERRDRRGAWASRAPTAALARTRGSTPFEDSELDVRFFFGRERERKIIEANLMASRLTSCTARPVSARARCCGRACRITSAASRSAI